MYVLLGLDLVVDFLHILESNTPLTKNGDCMKWKLKNEHFDICLLCNELWDPFSAVFPGKGIWKVEAPWWVSFFLFGLQLWDKILTGENLRTMDFAFVDWSVMCRFCREIVDHLLLHCEKTHQLLCFVSDPLGFSGSYKKWYLTLFLVGGIGWGSTLQMFGI